MKKAYLATGNGQSKKPDVAVLLRR